MIFLTVGSSWTPFDRLVEAAELLPHGEPVVVQAGASRVRPLGASICVPFLPFEDLVEHVRQARVVVTHAGVGSIMVALAHGHRPIVVPRLRRLGEAVDDHQLELARRLGEVGYVAPLEDVRRIGEAVAGAEAHEAAWPGEGAGRLAEELRDYMREAVGETAAAGVGSG
jgi:exopolysaccharide biosynthesis glucuronosyltransferase PssE